LARPPSPALFPYTTLFRSRYLEAEARAGRRQVVEVDGRDVARLRPLDQVLDELADRGLEQVLVRGDHTRVAPEHLEQLAVLERQDRKSTRLNSSHRTISYA